MIVARSENAPFWPVVAQVAAALFATVVILSLLPDEMPFSAQRIAGHLFLALLLFLVVRYNSGLSFSQLSFTRKKLLTNVALGLILGIVLALVPIALVPSHAQTAVLVRDKLRALPLLFVIFVGLFTSNGVACLLISISEEVAFRGIVLQAGCRYWGNVAYAAAFAAIFYSLFHLDAFLDGNYWLALFIVAKEITLSIVFFWRKSMGVAIGAHYAYDTTLLFLAGLSASQ